MLWFICLLFFSVLVDGCTLSLAVNSRFCWGIVAAALLQQREEYKSTELHIFRHFFDERTLCRITKSEKCCHSKYKHTHTFYQPGKIFAQLDRRKLETEE